MRYNQSESRLHTSAFVASFIAIRDLFMLNRAAFCLIRLGLGVKSISRQIGLFVGRIFTTKHTDLDFKLIWIVRQLVAFNCKQTTIYMLGPISICCAIYFDLVSQFASLLFRSKIQITNDIPSSSRSQISNLRNFLEKEFYHDLAPILIFWQLKRVHWTNRETCKLQYKICGH